MKIYPKNGDLEVYTGKRIELQNDQICIRGLVKGEGNSVVALSSTEVGHPWLVVTDDGDEIEVAPDGKWSLRLLEGADGVG
ncbi:hypothetical protein GMLC_20510 [Geomonas limicola]|uniref:Uncharacterized protein n=1 Tax=Geomonas limicola TaxID=2740186 RepID=A0A6V8N7A4_9BACT|nr:hypothetical protein [Geomonas limicola]GFO68472.1 hypothetical protein GMLC_20510 [Geomonas limicola]